MRNLRGRPAGVGVGSGRADGGRSGDGGGDSCICGGDGGGLDPAGCVCRRGWGAEVSYLAGPVLLDRGLVGDDWALLLGGPTSLLRLLVMEVVLVLVGISSRLDRQDLNERWSLRLL